MKKTILIIAIIVLVLGGVAAGFAVDLWHFAHQPAAKHAEDILIHITSGQSFKSISQMLHRSGIICCPTRFNWVARITGSDKNLKAGEYMLTAKMSPLHILNTLVEGDVKLYRVTVPEGYRYSQIAELLEQTGLVSTADFMAAAADRTLVLEHGIQAESFEGYLFPETYYFPQGVTSEKVISTMVARFDAVFSSEWKSRSRELGFSVHEIVTLASMIEKETGASFERPLISSVFHNRLKKKMRLESDPTVIYGLEEFDGNLTRKHLAAPTPYNTYKIRGLPPGPIANPGLHSLQAALFPAETKYLYFVSKKDRTHYFSANLKEHNRAVKKYQLLRR